MPSPGSGSPGTIVSPAAPDPAQDADNADPGQVESVKAGQRQTQTGKYGSQQVKPFKKDDSSSSSSSASSGSVETSWIEIEMVDEQGHAVPGEAYEITLPDNSVASGTLDDKGFARVAGFAPGSCKVSFPDLDKEAWETA